MTQRTPASTKPALASNYHVPVLLAGTLLLTSAAAPAKANGHHGLRQNQGGRVLHPFMTQRAQAALPAVQNVNRQNRNENRFINQTFQVNDIGHMINMRNGVDLNLGSTERTITLGAKLFSHQNSVTISTNDGTRELVAGSQVTAAEYVAAKQLLFGGKQDVQVDSNGRAIGGSVDLSSITSRRDTIKADDLYIPANVSTYGDFGRGSSFQIKGDLINAGSLYAVSSHKGITNGAIRADNITNQEGALIDASVNLSLRADDTLTNAGVISGTGDLTLSAGNHLRNSGSMAAANNLSVNAPHVVNSGSMTASTGSVTIDAPAALTVDNNGGVISALNGAINIHSDAFNGSEATTVTGGDLLSRELNVNAGQGVADISVNELTGVLNQKGLASHVDANTGELHLGNICLTGDPTYRNKGGGILIDGDITVGEALTIIARDDITNSAEVVITAGDPTKGYNITFIAGANITDAGTDTGNIGPIPPAVAGSGATIDKTTPASTGGGSVILGFNSASEETVTINSRSTALTGDHDGGDVTFIAFKGSNVGSGTVQLFGSSVNTGGLGTGKNGNITIMAGGSDPASKFSAIQTGNMDTTGGTAAGTGTVNIDNTQPITTGVDVVYDALGNLTAGGFKVGATPAGSSVFMSGTVNAANAITINTGKSTANEGLVLDPSLNATSTGATGTSAITVITANGDIISLGDTRLSAFTTTLNSGTGNIGTSKVFFQVNSQLTVVDADDIFLTNFNNEVPNFDINGDNVVLVSLGTIMHDLGFGVGGKIVGTGSVNLNCLSANIGLSELSPCEVDSPVLVLNSQQKTFVHNNFAGTTTLAGGPMGNANTFNLVVDGNLSMNADTSINSQSISVSANTAGASLGTLAGALNGTKSVEIITDKSITSANLTANIDTQLLTLISTNGDIGTSPASRLTTGTAVDSVVAQGFGGNVFLSTLKTKKFKLMGGFATDTFDFLGPSSYAVAGDVTTQNDNLILSAAAGTLTVNGVNLQSGKDLTLQVTDTVNAKKSFIKILAGANIETFAGPGNGEILISVGASKAPALGTAPTKGVQVGAEPGFNINWGQFGVTAKTSKKTLTRLLYAQNADITFNNPVAAKNIVLNGDVRIVADPVGDAPSGTGSGTGTDSNTASNTGGNTNAGHNNQSAGSNQGKHGRNDGSLSDFDDDFVSMQFLATGSTNITNGADFDLGSGARNIMLGQDLLDGNSFVTITSGGDTRTLTAGSLVTASEYIAANQVLDGGKQSLTIDADGRATGGEVNLSAIGSEAKIHADDLFIPVNVTAYGDFGRRSNFQVGGDLTNSGSLYALSTRHRADGIMIGADTIDNHGLISAIAPSGIDLGRRAVSGQDLILRADSISNSSGATITADGTVTLMSANVKNAGTINSNNGNVNFDASNAAIVVDNNGGDIKALNGAINIRTPDYNSIHNTNVYGGNLVSNELNVYGGQGTADLFVNQISGQINEVGYASHVVTSAGDMTLGNICMTGDPTFSNTAGNLNISGSISVAENLVIAARNSISSISATFASITASNPDGSGANITLVAGFQLTAGGSDGTIPPGTPVATTVDGTLAPAGGNVQLNNLILSASATKLDKDAGNITIIAAANGGVLGQFFQQSGNLSAFGIGTGKSGNITIIAGGNDTSANQLAIETFPIVASNQQTGSGGNILISNRQPTITGTGKISWDASGNVLVGSGTFAEGAIPGGNAGVHVHAQVTAGDTLTINSGNNSKVLVEPLNGANPVIRSFGANGTVNINLSGSTSFEAPYVPVAFIGSHILARNINITGGTGNIGTAVNNILVAPQISPLNNLPYLNVSALTGPTGDVFLATANPNVNTFNVTGDQVNIVSVGSIATGAAGSLTAASQLNLISSTGSIGLTNQHRLEINAPAVTLDAALGDVFVHNASATATDLQFGKALNNFFYSADKGINTAGTTITAAKNINLFSSTSIAQLSGTLTSNKITLGSGNSMQFGAGQIDPNALVAPNVVLTSVFGSVGSKATPFAVTDTIKNLTANSVIGDVFLSSNSTNLKNNLTLSGGSGTNWNYAGNFRSLLLNDITAGLDLNVTTVRTTITVNPNVVILSGEDILLQVSETLSPDSKKTKITFSPNSTVQTKAAPGSGDIEIILGTNSTPSTGPAIKETGVLELPGFGVFPGFLGIGAKTPRNTVAAIGADVEFSSPVKATNITLGGNVAIIADPPIFSGSAIPTGTTWGASPSPVTVQSTDNHTVQPHTSVTPDIVLNGTSVMSSQLVSDSMQLNVEPQTVLASLAPQVTPAGTAQQFGSVQQVNSRNGVLNLLECSGSTPLTSSLEEDDSYIISNNGWSNEINASVCAEREFFTAVSGTERASTNHMQPADVMNVSEGTILFAPDRDVTVKTNCGTLKIKAKSVVLVSNEANKLAVYNIDDYNHESVVLEVNGRSIALNPGRHVLVTNELRGDYAGINPIEAIAHRNVTNRMHNGMKLYMSEFSIPTAINSVSPVKALIRSQHPLAKRTAQHMFKTAAVVLHVSGKGGEYQLHTKPRLTAIAR